MYYCYECGKEFEKCDKIYERHNLENPPYERFSVCPNCKSTNFSEKNTTHCRCCGAKLEEDAEEYCSERCRKKGNLLWKKQMRKRKLQESTPINKKVKEIEEYNKLHNTSYSYGQYVAMTEQNLKVGRKKCTKKKRNT